MNDEKEEITNSLNQMLGSKSLDDMKLAVQIAKNQPDIIDKKLLQWYDLKDFIDLDKSIKLKELYSSEGGSDKVYIINLRKDKNDFSVTGYYSRRGKSMRHDTKYKGIYEHHAQTAFEKLLKQKLEKGYKLLNE